MQSSLPRADAELLVENVREHILRLFPDGAETYELVYAPRFMRLIDEFAAPAPARRGVVVAFRPKAK